MAWGHLLSSLIGRAARDRVWNEARQRMAEELRARGEEPPARDRPCDVGLVFALGIEAGDFEDRLDGAIRIRGEQFTVKQGGLAGRHVVFTLAGIGCERARRATELLISGHRPAWVISAGFAGGLQPELRTGDIIMVNSIVTPDGQRLAIDLHVSEDQLARHPGVRVGRLLTVDRIICRSAEKRELGERYDALAVEMETAAVAEVCRAQQTRFMAIRVISDTMQHELPADLDRLMRSTGGVERVGAAVGAMWRRPSSLQDMLKLREGSIEAADRLAKFLVGVVPQLAPASTEAPGKDS